MSCRRLWGRGYAPWLGCSGRSGPQPALPPCIQQQLGPLTASLRPFSLPIPYTQISDKAAVKGSMAVPGELRWQQGGPPGGYCWTLAPNWPLLGVHLLPSPFPHTSPAAVKVKKELFQAKGAECEVQAHDMAQGSAKRWNWEVRACGGRQGELLARVTLFHWCCALVGGLRCELPPHILPTCLPACPPAALPTPFPTNPPTLPHQLRDHVGGTKTTVHLGGLQPFFNHYKAAAGDVLVAVASAPGAVKATMFKADSQVWGVGG